VFLENKAKAAAGARAASSRGGNSPRPSEAGSSSNNAARRAILSTAVESDFEDDDYTVPERRGIASVTYSHCCATLLQQPQPLSFEAKEIAPDVYPPPKVVGKPRGTHTPGDSTIMITIPAVQALDDLTQRMQQLLAYQQQLIQALASAEKQTGIPAAAATPSPDAARSSAAHKVWVSEAVAAASSSQENRPAACGTGPGPRRFTSKRGVEYDVQGGRQAGIRSVQEIPNEELSHLLFRFPEVATYFKEAQHMFYFPQGAVDVRTPECSSGMIKHALRDHCADVNLVTAAFAERKGWRVVPTTTSLSTGTDSERKVLETVDTQDAFFHLLPGTPHEMRLRLEETLVVGDTDLFDLLVGNRQMKPVTDSLVQFPSARLIMLPNVLEDPDYTVSVPMTKGPLSPFCAAMRRVAFASVRATTAPGQTDNALTAPLGGELHAANKAALHARSPTLQQQVARQQRGAATRRKRSKKEVRQKTTGHKGQETCRKT